MLLLGGAGRREYARQKHEHRPSETRDLRFFKG
jgi:hypothetical protein